MNTPSVIHIGRLVGNWKADPHYVYIGRPSPLGNPFVIGRDGTRKQVIGKYSHWFMDKLEIQGPVRTEIERIRKLLQKDSVTLVCYCAPELCHGDVITLFFEIEKQAHHLLNIK